MTFKPLCTAWLAASLFTAAQAQPADGWELFDLMAEGLMGSWRSSDPARPAQMHFSFIGKETTLKEQTSEGVAMYHCKDIACTTLKASRYGTPTPPEFVANLTASTPVRFVFECDTANALCNSEEEHVHAFTYALGDSSETLTATYETWRAGKPSKITPLHFKKAQR